MNKDHAFSSFVAEFMHGLCILEKFLHFPTALLRETVPDTKKTPSLTCIDYFETTPNVILF